MSHIAQSGLQQHSVGGNYPYMVVGTQAGAGARVEYYALHAITGSRSHLVPNVNEAYEVIDACKGLEALGVGDPLSSMNS